MTEQAPEILEGGGIAFEDQQGSRLRVHYTVKPLYGGGVMVDDEAMGTLYLSYSGAAILVSALLTVMHTGEVDERLRWKRRSSALKGQHP